MLEKKDIDAIKEAVEEFFEKMTVVVSDVAVSSSVENGHNNDQGSTEEDKEVMKIFKNINSVWPESADEVSQITSKIINSHEPYYINLKR